MGCEKYPSTWHILNTQETLIFKTHISQKKSMNATGNFLSKLMWGGFGDKIQIQCHKKHLNDERESAWGDLTTRHSTLRTREEWSHEEETTLAWLICSRKPPGQGLVGNEWGGNSACEVRGEEGIRWQTTVQGWLGSYSEGKRLSVKSLSKGITWSYLHFF